MTDEHSPDLPTTKEPDSSTTTGPDFAVKKLTAAAALAQIRMKKANAAAFAALQKRDAESDRATPRSTSPTEQSPGGDANVDRDVPADVQGTAGGEPAAPPRAPSGSVAAAPTSPDFIARAMRPMTDMAVAPNGVPQLPPPEVRKPRRDEWVTAVPLPGVSGAAFDALESGGNIYVVAPGLVGQIRAPLFEARLEVMRNSQGRWFVWLRRTPASTGGRPHPAHVDAAKAASMAKSGWVRLWWDTTTMSYVIERPEGTIRDRPLPAGDLSGAVERSFADVYIDSLEHDVVRSLHGLS